MSTTSAPWSGSAVAPPGAAAPALLSGPPPPPLPLRSLLEQIPDPATVEVQKMAYERSLDEALQREVEALEQKHQAMLTFLRGKNEHQKRQRAAAIDHQLMLSEMQVQ